MENLCYISTHNNYVNTGSHKNQALLLISTRILYFGLGEGLGFMLCSPWGSAKSKVIWLDVSEKVRSNRDSLRVPRVNTPEHFSSCCRVEI